MHVNRREFLRKSLCAALGGVGLHSAFGNLQLIAAAAASQRRSFTDYKALVCVYLYGGNDSFNTLAPFDATHYGIYQGTRQALALAQSDLSANSLSPLAASGGLPGGLPSDGASYGMHPAMGAVAGGNAGLRGLFNTGKAAEAKPLVEKAVSIDPSNADAHYIYGMTLVAENPAKAKSEFEEFMKLAPTAPNAAIAKSLITELEKQIK